MYYEITMDIQNLLSKLKLPINMVVTAGVVFLVLAIAFPPLAIVFILISVVLIGTGIIKPTAINKMLGKKTEDK